MAAPLVFMNASDKNLIIMQDTEPIAINLSGILMYMFVEGEAPQEVYSFNVVNGQAVISVNTFNMSTTISGLSPPVSYSNFNFMTINMGSAPTAKYSIQYIYNDGNTTMVRTPGLDGQDPVPKLSYTKPERTVSYVLDGEGCSGQPDLHPTITSATNAVHEPGSYVYLPTAIGTFTKSGGYSLIGWFINANQEMYAAFEDGSVFMMPDSNVLIYPVWVKLSAQSTTQSITVSWDITSPAAPLSADVTVNGVTTSVAAGTQSFVCNGLTAGTSYNFMVEFKKGDNSLFATKNLSASTSQVPVVPPSLSTQSLTIGSAGLTSGFAVPSFTVGDYQVTSLDIYVGTSASPQNNVANRVQNNVNPSSGTDNKYSGLVASAGTYYVAVVVSDSMNNTAVATGSFVSAGVAAPAVTSATSTAEAAAAVSEVALERSGEEIVGAILSNTNIIPPNTSDKDAAKTTFDVLGQATAPSQTVADAMSALSDIKGAEDTLVGAFDAKAEEKIDPNTLAEAIAISFGVKPDLATTTIDTSSITSSVPSQFVSTVNTPLPTSKIIPAPPQNQTTLTFTVTLDNTIKTNVFAMKQNTTYTITVVNQLVLPSVSETITYRYNVNNLLGLLSKALFINGISVPLSSNFKAAGLQFNPCFFGFGSFTIEPDNTNNGGDNGGGNGAVCFLGNAPVMTPVGYRRIDSLAVGDMVRTADGRDVAIQRIKHQRVIAPSAAVNPYVIPKGTWGATENLAISPRHCVATPDRGMVEARELGLRQLSMKAAFDYYNLELPEWDNMIVAGVEVESLAPKKRVVMTAAEFRGLVASMGRSMDLAKLARIATVRADGSVDVMLTRKARRT
jgi:hypothetical protein